MTSKCVKCDGTSFRIEQQEPTGSNVKFYFVQCAKCGTPVGVVDYYPHGTILRRIEALEKTVTGLESNLANILANIDHAVRQIASRMR